MASLKKSSSYLFPLQSVAPVFWAFGASKGACSEMSAGLGKALTLPLPL